MALCSESKKITYRYFKIECANHLLLRFKIYINIMNYSDSFLIQLQFLLNKVQMLIFFSVIVYISFYLFCNCENQQKLCVYYTFVLHCTPKNLLHVLKRKTFFF